MAARILLVEDEPTIAEIVEFALAGEGFQVAWRTLACDAEAALSADAHDLLILDIGLPDGSGLELLEADKTRFGHAGADPLRPQRRTGSGTRLELGADDYVSKPFSPRELAARVKAILKRSARNHIIAVESAIGEPADSSGFEVDEARATIGFSAAPGLDPLRIPHPQDAADPTGTGVLPRPTDGSGFGPTRRQLRAQRGHHIKTLRAKLREIEPRFDPIRTIAVWAIRSESRTDPETAPPCVWVSSCFSAIS